MPKIFRKSTGKEITIEQMALEMYRNGSKIIYCDIETVVTDGECWYILDECGIWDYIDEKKYRVEG